MKKLYLFIFAFVAWGATAQTLRLQSFEGLASDDWGYTTDPATFNSGGDIWDTVSTLSGITALPTDGSTFFGITDLESPNGTSTGQFGYIRLDTVHLNGTPAFITFDYQVDGFDSGDDIEYELWADGVSQGTVLLVDGFSNLNQQGTETVNIPANTDSIRFEIRVKQNGSDYGAIDNIRLETGAAPPPPTTPMYLIADINNVDANGVADSNGVYCWTQGVVLGVNMRPSGLQFTIWDNEGIGIFNNTGNLGYTVMEGDSVMVRGTISQFNGLTQINPDSVVLVNSGNPIPAPRVVTTLDESAESDLVRIDNVVITAISGANYDIANATDTVVMRIDSDTDVLDSLSFAVGDSLCYVIGIGGQFDNSNPFTDGYQLFPRYYTDVDTTCGTTPPPPPATPMYPIADINNVDTNGVADSNGVYCWTQGVVLGVNMRPSGLQFTIWDNEGIGIFNNTGNLGYTVMEGDSVMVRGTISQFNGLTQINPDSVVLVNSGNPIPAPRVVTTLGESAESDLVRIDNVVITAISGANYDIANATDTVVMRIDSDTDVLDSLSFAVGDSLCYVIGIGGQFDNSNPFTDGYQLFPRYYTDVDTTCGTTPPPPPGTPMYLIADINNVDANGVADSNGVYCWTQGVVLGVNIRPSGLQFTIWDNEGIGIFNNSGNLGYTVMEGDSVMVRGTISQFNGLTQINPDSVVLVNSGNPIPTPRVVTTLDESTESDLVRIDNVLITAVSGSNYDIATATDTLVMRVDSDTDVLDSLSFAVGDSLCYVIGIGGQFDNSNPFTDGYQLFPRYYTDVDTTCGTTPPPPPPGTPMYPIADINNVDANGVADSNGVYCWTQGVVLGVNMRPSGLQFTIWDNEGIGIFNNTGNLGYTVMEGDSVMVRGTISQFNGLTQINPDSVVLVNSGNPIPTPRVVTTLDESTESDLVRVNDVLIIGVSGSNYDIATATDTLVMRVDSDTDVLDSLSFGVGDSLCYVIGIGGQFDNSNPFTDGYQLFPRYYTDVDTACGTTPPPPPSAPFYPIVDINNVDTNGVADSLGVTCWTKGIVIGVNIRPSGLQFTLWENEGINVFSFGPVSGYTVAEGDSLMVRGTIDQFNGLQEIIPDSIMVLNSGNPIPSPRLVATLDESTESDFIRINDVLITAVNPTGSSGTNYDIATATDTIVMRVDNDTDVDDSLSLNVGDSLCYIIGTGGQFDGSNPYTSGYQIFPMRYSDIDTACGTTPPPPPATPMYPIADINNVDANGVADSNQVYCWTQGIVLGVNIRPSGLQFTIWDNEGIGVFNSSGNLGYTVAEGDSIMIRGTVGQFNGLQQIGPDSIVLLNSGNTLPAVTTVTVLDENTESSLIMLEDLLVVGQSGDNYDVFNGTDTFLLRVDPDTDIYDSITLNIGDSICSATGIGGQFDPSSPYTSGYQILPRYFADVDTCTSGGISIGDVVGNSKPLVAYPNPVNGSELYFNKMVDVQVYNALGKQVMEARKVNFINVDELTSGVYIIRTFDNEVVKVIVR